MNSSTDNFLDTFSFMNIQGLHPQTTKSSVTYLNDLLNEQKYLFVALTETWLTNTHKEAELEINGYNLH